MRKRLLQSGLATAMLMGLSLTGADAAATKPMSPESLGLGPMSTPVAMCGRTCRNGGRYIPGPPQVCYEQGLEYCGPSRGGRGYGGGGGGGYGGGEPQRSGGSNLCGNWQRECARLYGAQTPLWQSCMRQPGAIRDCAGGR